VSLRSLAAYVVFELQDRATNRPLRFEFVPDDLEAAVEEANVHQILSNLVENALKYSDPDGPITIRGRAEPDEIVLSVEDRGPGIPEECRERVFERFYQVDQSRTRTVGGTGLGLYIARTLARDMGGDLTLDDTHTDGCRFVLRIPTGPPDDAAREGVEPGALVSR
jgi:signal transduction histidine kinase